MPPAGGPKVGVTRETAAGNYAEARRHQHDAKLVDAEGQLFPLPTPLEAGARGEAELKPHLGAAVACPSVDVRHHRGLGA